MSSEGTGPIRPAQARLAEESPREPKETPGKTSFSGLLHPQTAAEASGVAAPHRVAVTRLAMEIDPQALALKAAPPAQLEIQFESRVFDRLTITIKRTPEGKRGEQPLTIELTAANREAASILNAALPQLQAELKRKGHQIAFATVTTGRGANPQARRGAAR
jgi:hypothetical protein